MPTSSQRGVTCKGEAPNPDQPDSYRLPLRWDRTITLALYRLCLSGRPGPDRVLPILMYHSVSPDAEPGVAAYYRLCTSPTRFEAHMEALKARGYVGVTLSEGLQWLNTGTLAWPDARPAQPVAITFDDGFQDLYTAAWPVLQRLGFRATAYLPTAFIGETRRTFQPRGASGGVGVVGRPCLTWSEVKELAAAGIEMGGHTVTHPELPRLSWPEIEQEIRQCKDTLDQQLGTPVRSFAHPYAFPQERPDYVARITELLQAAGFDSAVTTRVGRVRRTTHRLVLCRLPVNDADDPTLLAAKLTGAYDWVGTVQRFVRFLKLRFRGPAPATAAAAPKATNPFVAPPNRG